MGGSDLWRAARAGGRQQHQDKIRDARRQARPRAPARNKPLDDKGGKPVGINQHIGRRPVAAFGNYSGDREMLEYTQGGGGARLELLVLHDDEREYAYGPALGLPEPTRVTRYLAGR